MALRIKLFIESYKGRGSLFSFWKELGYNRLVITEKNGLKHYFLFQIQGKQNFDRLLKDIKLIENYYPYNVSITKILT